jgi:hypothetical protein
MFAIINGSTTLFPPEHNASRHIRFVTLGWNATCTTASSHCIDEHFLNLKGICTGLERLNIFTDADNLVQAIPYLIRWILSKLVEVRAHLALKTTVTGIHQPGFEDAENLLRGRFGEPDEQKKDWETSFYCNHRWPKVAKTVVNMPSTRYITFHTADLSVGEEEVLEAYCARGFI